MSSLLVYFVGEEYRATDSLTFGRQGDIQLDTSPHLHRIAGQFLFHDQHWWLINRGSRLFLHLATAAGTRLELASGARHALRGGRGVVSLRVGGSLFELDYVAPLAPAVGESMAPELSGLTTAPFEAILTPREVDFLVTFARPVLEGRIAALPTYSEVADQWHVSKKTLDNTVQTLRRKLRNARLIRDESLDELVRVAVAQSLVTVADLEWAAFDTGHPRRSALGPRFRND